MKIRVSLKYFVNDCSYENVQTFRDFLHRLFSSGACPLIVMVRAQLSSPPPALSIFTLVVTPAKIFFVQQANICSKLKLKVSGTLNHYICECNN